MKIKSSLKSIKKRDLNSKLVRRRGRVYSFEFRHGSCQWMDLIKPSQGSQCKEGMFKG